MSTIRLPYRGVYGIFVVNTNTMEAAQCPYTGTGISKQPCGKRRKCCECICRPDCDKACQNSPDKCGIEEFNEWLVTKWKWRGVHEKEI